MTDERRPGAIDRRSLMRFALASLVAAALPPVATAAAPAPPGELASALVDGLLRSRRFLFRCRTSRGVVAEFTRLDALWAHGDYTRFISCEVTYVGPGEASLTAQETAVVRVAERAGLDLSDRPGFYRTLLASSARIPLDQLEGRLDSLGVPGVTAALALAPEAPQADLLADWLDRRAP